MLLSVFRRAALSALERSFGGALKVVERGAVVLNPAVSDFAVVTVSDPRAYRFIAQGGVGAAESFALGMWQTPDLRALLGFAARNLRAVNAALDGGWRRNFRVAAAALSRPARMFRAAARRDIAAHYDLGDDFFALFLDSELAYSCAVYPGAESDLESASRNKMRIIADDLRLQEADRFLDLGCGWGGLSAFAVRDRGCETLALTLSRRQFEFVRAKAARENLGGKLTPVLRDYRDFSPPSPFAKIASVEMIEAVGPGNLGEYFRNLRRLLADDGLALVQAIVIPESRRESSLADPDFIRRRVFPGGALHSREAMSAAAQASGLRPAGLRDITPHYARTLSDWRVRFNRNRESAGRMGFGESFCRRWEYYLCYCEAGFAEKVIGVAQSLFAGPERDLETAKAVPD